MQHNINFLIVKFGKGFDLRINTIRTFILTAIIMVLLAACGTSHQGLPQEVEELPEEIETTVENPSDIKMGTDRVYLPGFSEPTEVSYQIINGYATYGGDINLGKVDEQGKLIKEVETQSVAISDTPYNRQDYRWPDGVVTFRITGNWDVTDSSQTLTNIMKQRIADAMEHWETHTSIRFKEASSSTEYAVDFVNLPQNCNAPPGYKFANYGNLVQLGFYSCGVGEIIHELGHVVGLWHEQQRSDRSDNVNYYQNNVENMQFNDQWFNPPIIGGQESSRHIGEYDLDSIMHYGCYDFSIDVGNLKTLEPKDPNIGCASDNGYAFGYGIGQRERLSPGDIANVNWLYLDDWVVSYSDGRNNNAWQQVNTDEAKLKDIKFADFNNNGTTDIVSVKTISRRIRWLVYKEAGQGNWQYLTRLGSIRLSDLAFGDFNGNGTTDIFYTDGAKWRLKEAGTSRLWLILHNSTLRVPQLGFGDFNGNGRTDVFYPKARFSRLSWYYNDGGRNNAVYLGRARAPLSKLGFGDFNGNGTTDVFIASGRRFSYIDGGKGLPRFLQNSNTSRSALHLGDFNGDGKTDVFRSSAFRWYVAYGGRGSWRVVNNDIKLPPHTIATNTTNYSNSFIPYRPRVDNRSFAFGDFNGDGKTDVFKTLKWY